MRAVPQPTRQLFCPKAQIASVLHSLANPLEPSSGAAPYGLSIRRRSREVSPRNQTSIHRGRAPPLNRETPQISNKGKLSFQNLSHFVEEAIVARDWLE